MPKMTVRKAQKYIAYTIASVLGLPLIMMGGLLVNIGDNTGCWLILSGVIPCAVLLMQILKDNPRKVQK